MNDSLHENTNLPSVDKIRAATKWSRYAFLRRSYQRNPKGPKRYYLYVFPEGREKGWLCDGNDHRGKEINRRARGS